jgi:hypothetical protein
MPDEDEPGALPVEPDQGAVPDHIPDDPEHDREIDPEATKAKPVRRSRVEDARCP